MYQGTAEVLSVESTGENRATPAPARNGPAHAVQTAAQSQNAQQRSGRAHDVQYVDAQQVPPGAAAPRENPALQAKQDRQQEQEARALQRLQHALAGGEVLAAVHPHAVGGAGQEQEDGRGFAAEELREGEVGSAAVGGTQEGVEGVPLQHDHGRHAAHPVYEQDSRLGEWGHALKGGQLPVYQTPEARGYARPSKGPVKFTLWRRARAA